MSTSYHRILKGEDTRTCVNKQIRRRSYHKILEENTSKIITDIQYISWILFNKSGRKAYVQGHQGDILVYHPHKSHSFIFWEIIFHISAVLLYNLSVLITFFLYI